MCTSEGQTDKKNPYKASVRSSLVIASRFTVLFTYPSSKGFFGDKSFTALTEAEILLHMGAKESQTRPRAELVDAIINDQWCFPNLLFFVALLSGTSV